MVGYRNSIYNSREKSVELYTWDDNGVRITTTLSYSPYFFYEDSKGDELSIYNTKLKKRIFDTYYDKTAFLKETGMKRVFENFSPSQQSMIDMYWEHCDSEEFSKFPLKIYMLDIEAVGDGAFSSPHDPQDTINVITVYDSLSKKYYVWGMGPYTSNDPSVIYYNCKTETQLLKLFLIFMRDDPPDIISGWNSDGYDVPYIINRIKMILDDDEASSISPVNNIYTKTFAGKFGTEQIVYRISGISCVDYMDIYKKFCAVNRESYRLDYIAQVELDSQKLDYSGMSLYEFMTKDWQRFVEYNIHDVKLLVQLEEKLHYIELLRRLAYIGCTSFESALGTVSVVAGAAAIKARKAGKRLSTFVNDNSVILPGAYVAEPVIGHHKSIVTYDANSLYPNLMITLNMSPETKIGKIIEKTDTEVSVRHVNGQIFKLSTENFLKFIKKEKVAISKAMILFSQKNKGILSELVDQFYSERKVVQKKLKSAKMELDKLQKKRNKTSDDMKSEESAKVIVDQLNARQLSIKIFCNSVYGCFGNKYSPISDDDIAASITLTGQSAIKKSREIAKQFISERTGITDDEKLENAVIAGDTDSIFVSFDQTIKEFSVDNKPTEEAYEVSQSFEDYLNYEIGKWAKKTLNSLDPRLQFKREVMCDYGMLLQKKRYVLHILDKEGIQCDDWKYTGVEIVRTTMPKVIKPYVRKIIETMIMTKNEGAVNTLLKEAYDAFCLLNVVDISLVSGIKKYEEYERKCSGFNTVKGMPCHVKAAYFYNKLIKDMGLNNKYQYIKSGDKIKYFYVQKPNKYGISAIAFKHECPIEFNEVFKLDLEKMFEKDMYMCVERFYETMKWVPRKPTEQILNNLEDIFG